MKRFSIVNNGYDIGEVNRFIDIVIRRLEKLNAENVKYASLVDELNNKLNQNNDSSKLEKALLAVEETADRIKNASMEEARIIVEEAKNNANAIVHEALLNAEKTEQERLLLEKNMKIYKEKIKSLIEAELRIAEDIDKITL